MHTPSNDLLQQLFKLSIDPIIIVDSKGYIHTVNPQTEPFFGYKADELIGQFIEILVPEASQNRHKELRSHYTSCPTARPMGSNLNLNARHKNGQLLPIDISLCPVHNEHDESLVIVMIRDNSFHRSNENKLNYLAIHDPLTGLINSNGFKENLKLTIEEASVSKQLLAVCMIDIDDFKSINDTFGHEVGNQLLEAFGLRLRQNTHKRDIVSRFGGDEFVCLIKEANNSQNIIHIVSSLHQAMTLPYKINDLLLNITISIGISIFPLDASDGKTLMIQADRGMYHMKSAGKNGYFLYNQRLSDHKEINDDLIQKNYTLKHYDLLTGVANFSKFRTDLTQRLTTHAFTPYTFLLCGIDNFKLINNSFGTIIADQLITMIALRIKESLQGNDYIARKGGDEFILVIPESSLSKISNRARNILGLFINPFHTNDKKISITVSIGISRYLKDSDQFEELCLHADIAMHQAKKFGKNNYQIFSKKIATHVRYIQKLQNDLPYALEREELFLCYQPQVDIISKKIIGAEALLRWKSASLGLIHPDLFVPLMEKSGLIIPIGEWVLQQACLQAKSWQQIDPTFKISVNISVSQLTAYRHKTQFSSSVKNALRLADLSPEYLELEITEGVMVHYDTITKSNLKKLKNLGISISCDDFGIEYASFNRLKQLPLDTIKIDKSLTMGITRQTIDLTIVKSIIAIAKQLNINVIAEGVVTTDQIHILKNLGCTLMQGFYFSKPVLPNKFKSLLKHKWLDIPEQKI